MLFALDEKSARVQWVSQCLTRPSKHRRRDLRRPSPPNSSTPNPLPRIIPMLTFRRRRDADNTYNSKYSSDTAMVFSSLSSSSPWTAFSIDPADLSTRSTRCL
ncbi:unnamed protein product, partial [Ectocarpus sp. 12 AP-2014]